MDAAEIMEQARSVLSQVFGYPEFRHGQAEAVAAAMSGRDAAVLLPTGGGKSLCYQVPAIARARQGLGPTLVVSPLIALMHDQVRALRGQGVGAAALNSHQSASEASETLRAFEAGELDLLYVSPERAAQPGFRRALKRRPVGLFAIDEAHCVSQWGHDFRPEYMQLAELRDTSDAPMMAVTATATPRVLKELCRRLGLRDPRFVRGDFRRPNLSFSVEHIRSQNDRLKRLAEHLEAAGLRSGETGKAIVYCSTRKHTEAVAADLIQRGFAARHYHAGRTTRDRERAQTAFGVGRLNVLVATNAFGMGIDFPNVRVVAHYGAPGSLEAYYQEAGRAGRDGDAAKCVMFFGASDLATHSLLASSKSAHEALAGIEHYANSDACREQQICAHFGIEESPECGRCDVCTGTVIHSDAPPPAPFDALDEAQVAIVVAAVGELSKPAGKTGIARALRGSRAKTINKCGLLKISQHGKLRGVDERAIIAAIDQCLEEGTLVPKGSKYPTVWLPGKPVRSTSSEKNASPYAKPRSTKKRSSNRYSMLQGALERFRKQKARELKWKPYMVFQKRTIVALDDERPRTLAALRSIPGLGHAKVERFGSEILRLVRENP